MSSPLDYARSSLSSSSKTPHSISQRQGETSDLNPFRPPTAKPLVPIPPPLPARKSLADTPRRPASTTTSTSSHVSLAPTSNAPPSDIIRHSLAAAQSYSIHYDRPTVHVLKTSKSSPQKSAGPRSKEIVKQVHTALSQSERGKEWDCRSVLTGLNKGTPRYAMIIVNQPIKDYEIFCNAWQSCGSERPQLLTLSICSILRRRRGQSAF